MLTERGLDWVLNGLGAIALIVGGIVVLWALFADRSRGRKRCPKCWYDLTASPEPRCSECGFVARTERKLRKTRRRWRRGVVGLFIIAVGLAGPGYREYHDDWHRLVPTTALILWMPDLEKKQPKLYGSLESRMADDRLADWQWEWLLDRCLDENKLPVSVQIKTRERWPEGVDIPYEVIWSPRTTGIQWLDDATTRCKVVPRGAGADGYPNPDDSFELTSTRLFPSPMHTAFGKLPAKFAHADSMHFDIELSVRYWSSGASAAQLAAVQAVLKQRVAPGPSAGQTLQWPSLAGSTQPITITMPEPGPELKRTVPLEAPIVVSGTLHDVIAPVQDSDIDEALRQSTSLSSPMAFGTGADGVYVGVPTSVVGRRRELAVAVVFELTYDGAVVLTERRILQPGVLHLLNLPEGVRQVYHNDADRWTVRIRGDGELALQDFDATSYWAGDITFPLRQSVPVRLSE